MSNPEKAYKELESLGCPVFKGDCGGYFQISGEDENSILWANYWIEDYRNYDCGISKRCIKILKKHGLFAEWYNCVIARVFDI